MGKIRFGGPNLSGKQFTWFETLVNGELNVIPAREGDTFDESEVCRQNAEGNLAPAADYYISAGLATRTE